MWIFTRYGFYSIASAGDEYRALDAKSVMIRARLKVHLQNLKKRFPELEDVEILVWPRRDYRYRIIIPKAQWVAVVAGLASEQEWSNFKNETARYPATGLPPLRRAGYPVLNPRGLGR